MPILEKVKSDIGYDPDTGLIFWKTPGRARTVGKSPYINNHHSSGYLSFQIYVEGKPRRVYVHRAAFAIVEGRWPTEVDHIDRDPSNNRWDNLRECTRTENHLNHGLRKDNVSGVVGVKPARYGKWRVAYKQKHHGTYDTIAEAAKVRANLEETT